MRVIDDPTKAKQPTIPPPSLNEQFVSRHCPRLDDDPVIDELTAAVRDARLAASEIGKRHDVINGDQMRTPVARQKAARATAFKLFENGARKLDRTIEKARTQIEGIDGTGPAKAPITLDRELGARELRAVLRGMAGAERSKAVATAIERDDKDLLGAVLHGHPVASGLSEPEHRMLRARWMQRRHPDLVTRRARLVAAIEETERLGALMLTWTSGLTDDTAIKTAEASARAATEAETVVTA